MLGVVDLAGPSELVPLARDAARFRAVRSLISSRSYSASDPRTPIIIRPAAVDQPSDAGLLIRSATVRRAYSRYVHRSSAP